MKKYLLTPSRKHVGRAVARRSKSAMVSEVLKDPLAKRYMVQRMGMLVRRELVSMCSDKVGSVLRSQSRADLQAFTWDKLVSELATTAPTLLSLLQACTYTRRLRDNRNAVIGMCCAILLKLRFSKMCVVQKMVSLVLYAGNSGKQVCNV